MDTFELEAAINEVLYSQIVIGAITSEKVENLRLSLGCLAFNLFAAKLEKIEEKLAPAWILHRDNGVPLREKPSQGGNISYEPPHITVTPEEFRLSEKLLGLAVKFEFLVQKEGFIYFSGKENYLQEFFCAYYCRVHPIDNDILNGISYRTLNIWNEIDANLPDKLWQFIREGKEDKEHKASIFMGTIGERNSNSGEESQSIWSLITEEQVVTLLLEGLQDNNSVIRYRASMILTGKDNSRIVDPFLEALNDSNPGVRENAASGLGKLEEKKAGPKLIELLKDPMWNVRQQAVYSLSYIKDPAAVEPLLEVLKNDEKVAPAVAMVIRVFEDTRAVDPLIEVLEEDWPELKKYAAESLGELGEKRAIKPLTKLFEDKDNPEIVRFKAAYGLGLLGDATGKEVLLEALLTSPADTSKYRTRAWRAAKALGNIGNKDAVGSLIAVLPTYSSMLKNETALALGKLGDKIAIDPLIKLLDEGWSDIRASAAWALGQLAAESALAKLKEMALNDEGVTIEGNKVRQLAAEAVMKITGNFTNLE